MQQQQRNDRDGRPCEQRGDGRREADCRPRDRDGDRG
jgi:hypothetical protein